MLTFTQSRRILSIPSVGVAVLGTSLAVAAGASAASKLPSATTAAKECAGKTAISQPLVDGNVAFLEKYVPCVTTALRGARMTQSTKVAQLAESDLKTFEAGKVTQAANDTKTASAANGKSYCKKSNLAIVELADSTPPPALTPLLIAQNTVKTLNLDNNLARSSKAVFGFAFDSLNLFHDASTSTGISFVGVIIDCSVKG